MAKPAEYELDGGNVVKSHQPCDACGSSDALCIYDDHTYCFSCQNHEQLGERKELQVADGLVPFGYFRDLASRKLTEDICRKFGYFKSTHSGKNVQVAPYRDASGTQVVAQKLRDKDKNFSTVGSFKNVQLFGQHLWGPGRRLVITEGELDAISYASVAPGWPVVSVPSGAASAVSAIRRNIEFVNSFDEVVIMFDNDEDGRKFAPRAAEVVQPGKAKICTLPLKDASDMVQAGRVKELISAVWQAASYRPDGILNGQEIWNEVSKPIQVGTPYPFENWNNTLFGLRPREVVCISSGTGVGKSTICAEIAYALGVGQNKTVGYVALEEGVGRSGLRMMALSLNKPIHLPNDISEDDKKKAFDATLGTGRFFFYDHWGSLEAENLMGKLEFMVQACGCEYIVLDHLSILSSGLEASKLEGGSERTAIDYTMTQLRSFAERTNACVIVVSHLRRPQGDKGHEGGEKVYLSHLRGSQSIAQLSDAVVSISRDMSSGENEIEVNCLKNRYAGITGPMGTLRYDAETGRLHEVIDDFA